MDGTDVREWFVKYGREIEIFLTRRVACRDTAADLTQDLFLRLLKVPPAERIRNVRAYLYRAAANIAIDHRAAGSRRQRHAGAARRASSDVDTITPERRLSDEQALHTMIAALQELPPITRAIFTLVRIRGVKQAEAAEQLDLHITTVEKHVMRAVRHCYERVLALESAPDAESPDTGRAESPQ